MKGLKPDGSYRVELVGGPNDGLMVPYTGEVVMEYVVPQVRPELFEPGVGIPPPVFYPDRRYELCWDGGEPKYVLCDLL